jgi:hypothetical protein
MCGARTSSVIANCEYCGIEINRAAESKITPHEMTNALTKRIADAKGIANVFSGGECVAEAIVSFPLPTEINLLTQFFLFCHGNVREGYFFSVIDARNPERAAWRAKAKAAYQALRLASLNNPQLTSFLAPLDKIYGVQSNKFFGC